MEVKVVLPVVLGAEPKQNVAEILNQIDLLVHQLLLLAFNQLERIQFDVLDELSQVLFVHLLSESKGLYLQLEVALVKAISLQKQAEHVPIKQHLEAQIVQDVVHHEPVADVLRIRHALVHLIQLPNKENDILAKISSPYFLEETCL